MTILELREKRNKAWEAAKAFLESHRTGERDTDGRRRCHLYPDGAGDQ